MKQIIKVIGISGLVTALFASSLLAKDTGPLECKPVPSALDQMQKYLTEFQAQISQSYPGSFLGSSAKNAMNYLSEMTRPLEGTIIPEKDGSFTLNHEGVTTLLIDKEMMAKISDPNRAETLKIKLPYSTDDKPQYLFFPPTSKNSSKPGSVKFYDQDRFQYKKGYLNTTRDRLYEQKQSVAEKLERLKNLKTYETPVKIKANPKLQAQLAELEKAQAGIDKSIQSIEQELEPLSLTTKTDRDSETANQKTKFCEAFIKNFPPFRRTASFSLNEKNQPGFKVGDHFTPENSYKEKASALMGRATDLSKQIKKNLTPTLSMDQLFGYVLPISKSGKAKISRALQLIDDPKTSEAERIKNQETVGNILSDAIVGFFHNRTVTLTSTGTAFALIEKNKNLKPALDKEVALFEPLLQGKLEGPRAHWDRIYKFYSENKKHFGLVETAEIPGDPLGGYQNYLSAVQAKNATPTIISEYLKNLQNLRDIGIHINTLPPEIAKACQSPDTHKNYLQLSEQIEAYTQANIDATTEGQTPTSTLEKTLAIGGKGLQVVDDLTSPLLYYTYGGWAAGSFDEGKGSLIGAILGDMPQIPDSPGMKVTEERAQFSNQLNTVFPVDKHETVFSRTEEEIQQLTEEATQSFFKNPDKDKLLSSLQSALGIEKPKLDMDLLVGFGLTEEEQIQKWNDFYKNINPPDPAVVERLSAIQGSVMKSLDKYFLALSDALYQRLEAPKKLDQATPSELAVLKALNLDDPSEFLNNLVLKREKNKLLFPQKDLKDAKMSLSHLAETPNVPAKTLADHKHAFDRGQPVGREYSLDEIKKYKESLKDVYGADDQILAAIDSLDNSQRSEPLFIEDIVILPPRLDNPRKIQVMTQKDYQELLNLALNDDLVSMMNRFLDGSEALLKNMQDMPSLKFLYHSFGWAVTLGGGSLKKEIKDQLDELNTLGAKIKAQMAKLVTFGASKDIFDNFAAQFDALKEAHTQNMSGAIKSVREKVSQLRKVLPAFFFWLKKQPSLVLISAASGAVKATAKTALKSLGAIKNSEKLDDYYSKQFWGEMDGVVQGAPRMAWMSFLSPTLSHYYFMSSIGYGAIEGTSHAVQKGLEAHTLSSLPDFKEKEAMIEKAQEEMWNNVVNAAVDGYFFNSMLKGVTRPGFNPLKGMTPAEQVAYLSAVEKIKSEKAKLDQQPNNKQRSQSRKIKNILSDAELKVLEKVCKSALKHEADLIANPLFRNVNRSLFGKFLQEKTKAEEARVEETAKAEKAAEEALSPEARKAANDTTLFMRDLLSELLKPKQSRNLPMNKLRKLIPSENLKAMTEFFETRCSEEILKNIIGEMDTLSLYDRNRFVEYLNQTTSTNLKEFLEQLLGCYKQRGLK